MRHYYLAATVASVLATASFSDTTSQTITQLPACGSEAKNGFGAHKEYPAIDESNGYVGFKTEDIDANGLKERYTLVNCATRSLVQLNSAYALKNSAQGVPAGDMLGFVDGLHKQKKIANEALFAGIAAQNGYAVTKGKLDKPFTAPAARAECGCQLYYPETVSLWVK